LVSLRSGGLLWGSLISYHKFGCVTQVLSHFFILLGPSLPEDPLDSLRDWRLLDFLDHLLDSGLPGLSLLGTLFPYSTPSGKVPDLSIPGELVIHGSSLPGSHPSTRDLRTREGHEDVLIER